MSVKEQLIAARKLIERPEDWCQGAFQKGNARCASGALSETTGSLEWLTTRPAYIELSKAMYGQYSEYPGNQVCNWNDSHTHAEVLAAFDKAIASLEVWA